jgi:nicotinate-nucleotide adenylyltransferase
MRAGFFGGTFDPPHRGHLAVARAAADEFSLDAIFFAPVASQPLKPGGTHASFTDRLAMVELLCAAQTDSSGHTHFVPSDLDAPRKDGHPNFTIDTLSRLRGVLQETEKLDEVELFVITGADSFLDLRRWREPDALLQSAQWIVVSRPGFSLADFVPLALTPEQRGGVHLLEDVHETVSASEVRERLEAGLGCESLLTSEVYSYIREHGLYLPHTRRGEGYV